MHLQKLDRKIRIRIEVDLISEESERLYSLLEHKKNLDSAWIEVVTSWDAEKRMFIPNRTGLGLMVQNGLASFQRGDQRQDPAMRLARMAQNGIG